MFGLRSLGCGRPYKETHTRAIRTFGAVLSDALPIYRAMNETMRTNDKTNVSTLNAIADEAFAAFNSGGRHVPSFSARFPAFGLDDAYRVTALVKDRRVAQGYKLLGRKVGFTNRRLWDEYGVRAPNWGYIYDRTVHDLAVPLPLAPYTDPKIEP